MSLDKTFKFRLSGSQLSKLDRLGLSKDDGKSEWLRDAIDGAEEVNVSGAETVSETVEVADIKKSSSEGGKLSPAALQAMVDNMGGGEKKRRDSQASNK